VIHVVPAAVLVKPHLPAGRKRLFRNRLRTDVVSGQSAAALFDDFSAATVAGSHSSESKKTDPVCYSLSARVAKLLFLLVWTAATPAEAGVGRLGRD
jgi:hypothetical protein